MAGAWVADVEDEVVGTEAVDVEAGAVVVVAAADAELDETLLVAEAAATAVLDVAVVLLVGPAEVDDPAEALAAAAEAVDGVDTVDTVDPVDPVDTVDTAGDELAVVAELPAFADVGGLAVPTVLTVLPATLEAPA